MVKEKTITDMACSSEIHLDLTFMSILKDSEDRLQKNQYDQCI